ncbi:MAG: response regulator [Bdellovibrionota bacterium]
MIPSKTPAQSHKFKIMIIEDSPTTLKLYKKEIAEKYDVDYFQDARSALSHYENTKYDLVITDLMLPLKSGEALIFDIKYSNPTQKIAVISGSPDSLQLKEYDNIQVFEKPAKICEIISCTLLGRTRPDSKTDTIQRRKHKRFHVSLDAVLLVSNEKISINVTNVSLGGLLIKGGLPSSIHDESIPITLSILNQNLSLNVKRCWQKDGVGTGVKFQSLGHSEYSLLELFLESLRADNDT